MLLRLPVGVVLIDEQYDILFLNAAARRLLGIHGTAVGSDFVHLAHQFPSDDLRSAIAAAIRGESSALSRPLDTESEQSGEATHVQLTLQPFQPSGAEPLNAIAITVVDVSDAVRQRSALDAALNRLREDQHGLEERLDRVTRSNRDLLTANEEMTNANVLLRSSNEELLVANEEVQAATEEVETLNEELQAANEELETLNEELQATVEELNTTNDDLEARSQELGDTAASLAEQRQQSDQERERLALILDGMSEAVLVVDRHGRTVATNRAYAATFGEDVALVPEDGTGHRLPDEEWPQVRAARGEPFAMTFAREDASGERRWYEASGRPGGDWGGIIVIRDITERSLRHLQERFIDTASH
jgi:two-component system CheB/CheR fusion protein